jgi:hypothetical protein
MLTRQFAALKGWQAICFMQNNLITINKRCVDG